MRCSAARRSILDSRLGLLPEDRAARLHEHLAGCESCAASARNERRIAAELALLRVSPPFRVRVEDRVMLRVAGLGRVSTREAPAGQIGAWSLAAGLAAMVFIATFVSQAPSPEALWPAVKTIALQIGRGLGDVAGPIIAFARLFRPIADAIQHTAGALDGAWRHFEPIARWVILACASTSLAIAIFVVGRDFLPRPAPQER